MSHEFETIQLPTNASERVRILRVELAKALKGHIIVEMNEILGKLFEQYPSEFDGVNRNRPVTAELSFTYEGDDEGGTNTYIDYVEFTDEHGESVDIDFKVNVTYNYGTYEENFLTAVREKIQDSFNCEELEEYFDGYKFDLR